VHMHASVASDTDMTYTYRSVMQLRMALCDCSPGACVDVQCPDAGSSRRDCQDTERHAQRLLGVHRAFQAQVPKICGN
jgi:hypothetical protein